MVKNHPGLLPPGEDVPKDSSHQNSPKVHFLGQIWQVIQAIQRDGFGNLPSV
jgi:hypothetical protein